MDERVLISRCREYLDAAAIRWNDGDPEGYKTEMSDLLYLLTKELVGDAPEQTERGKAPGPGEITEAMNYDRQGGPEQQAAEPEQQGDKAKSDAANRRKAGKSPW